MNLLLKNKYYFLLLLGIGYVFYILNVYTPFSHDDYAYCFYYDTDSYVVRPTNIRVTNVLQMFDSMWNHYMCVNGRFVSHLLLQCFCAFLGKGVFNVCNTLVFVLFLHTIVLLSGHKYSVLMLLLSFLFSLCLLPYPGQTMLWMTGSLNYLWPTTFTIIYIYWLSNYKYKKTSFVKHIVLFGICFVVGWMNESVSVPVTMGLFIYFIFNKCNFKGLVISSFVGYALGACLIVFSPGTLSRLSSGEVDIQMDVVQFTFLHVYNVLYEYIHNILPIIAFIVSFIVFKVKYRNRCSVIVHNMYALLLIFFTVFLVVLGMLGERIYFGISVISLLIIFDVIDSTISSLKKKVYASILLLFLCIIPIRSAISQTKDYSDFDNATYCEVKKSSARCLVKAHYYNKNKRFSNVISPAISADIDDFHNRVKAFYYEKEYIQALPVNLYDAIINETFDTLIVRTDREVNGERLYKFDNYWILPIDECPKFNVSMTYFYPANRYELSNKQKFIRYLMNTSNVSSKRNTGFYIEFHGKFYLVFERDEKVVGLCLDY